MLKEFNEWLLTWKPIHLCWWFEKHNKPIPKYFIGGGGSPPSVTTNAATSVGNTTATLNGNVTSDGGATITARGFVYSSTDATPTIGEGGVTNTGNLGGTTGTYTHNATGLSAGTQYWYQAYATNSKGTTYGGVQTFTTTAVFSRSPSTVTLTATVNAPTVSFNLDYSKEDEASLGTDDTDLSTAFTVSDYSDVASDNATRNSLSFSTNGVFLFKVKNDNNTESIEVSWNGQTDLAPSTSTVYLQIYNRNTPAWETLDSDNTTAVDTDFTLSGTQSTNLSNYYDGNYWVACRVYQVKV